MRVAVIHNTLNSAGGGERVALETIRALRELGAETTLITVEPTNWLDLQHFYGEVPVPDAEEHVLPGRVRYFGIYARLLTFLKLLHASGKYDVTINTHGDVMPVATDIIYMHYPTFALLREQAANTKYGRFPWNIYFWPYSKIQGFLARRMRGSIILTNSSYSAEAIRRHLGAEASVVYPPVDVDAFRCDPGHGRRIQVATVGRFSPEKNYEFVLDVAERLRAVEFRIVGTVANRYNRAYLERIRRLAEERGLDNVRLHPNASLEELREMLCSSKAYLHAMRGEHFGIAVVEAMAAGLVPVVPFDGGPYRDILIEGRLGHGYGTLEEAVAAVKLALEEHDRMMPAVVKRASFFRADRFREELKKYVLGVVRRKGA